MPDRVTRFEAAGHRIYRLALDLFPGLQGYAYLVVGPGIRALIDCGSGFGDSDQQLELGLGTVAEQYDERVSWDSLTHVLITHGHIDHFGGLHCVRRHTQAPLVVHSLDRRILQHYEERLSLTAARLERFLLEAGISDEGRANLMELYLINKYLFRSIPVQATYESLEMRVGPLQVIHVPGHCPGHVALLLGDVLFSGDHILERTSPHQAPESLARYTGLGHYLESLDRLLPLSPHLRLVLGGHEKPIHDLAARIRAIKAMHQERLEKVLALLEKPGTVADVSRALFPRVEGYHVLLALEEAGAHVEYLALRGHLRVVNHEAIARNGRQPILYQREEGLEPPNLFAAPAAALPLEVAGPPSPEADR